MNKSPKLQKTTNTFQEIPPSLAEEVAEVFGGKLSKLTTGKGFKIEIGTGKNPTVIRLMDAGSGQRKCAYFRIGKSGKGCLDKTGKYNIKHGLTHFDINSTTLLEDIKQILTKKNNYYVRRKNK